jgi:hypothetical protein
MLITGPPHHGLDDRGNLGIARGVFDEIRAGRVTEAERSVSLLSSSSLSRLRRPPAMFLASSVRAA